MRLRSLFRKQTPATDGHNEGYGDNRHCTSSIIASNAFPSFPQTRDSLRIIQHRHGRRTFHLGLFRRLDREGGLCPYDTYQVIDAINRQHDTQIRPIGPHKADILLATGLEHCRALGLAEYAPFAVDAFIAFERPYERLKKHIVFAYEEDPTLVLPTGKHAGDSNIALVAIRLTAGDFKPCTDGILLDIPDSRLIPIPFPTKSGWYEKDPRTTVPGIPLPDAELHAGQKDVYACYPYGHPGVRFLSKGRNQNGLGQDYFVSPYAYVGPLVRNMHLDTIDVEVDYRFTAKLGVIVEIPVCDLGKLEGLQLQPAHTVWPAK